jgi:hypothetical protein
MDPGRTPGAPGQEAAVAAKTRVSAEDVFSPAKIRRLVREVAKGGDNPRDFVDEEVEKALVTVATDFVARLLDSAEALADYRCDSVADEKRERAVNAEPAEKDQLASEYRRWLQEEYDKQPTEARDVRLILLKHHSMEIPDFDEARWDAAWERKIAQEQKEKENVEREVRQAEEKLAHEAKQQEQALLQQHQQNQQHEQNQHTQIPQHAVQPQGPSGPSNAQIIRQVKSEHSVPSPNGKSDTSC